MQFSAKSKFLDISHSIKLYYILFFGIILCIISFFLYKNLLVTVTMIISTILAYTILSKPPQTIEIKILEEGIDIDGSFIDWANCYAWAVVDLGEDLEFVIYSNYIIKSFQYFYLKENSEIAKNIIATLSQILEYDEEIPKRNQSHAFLRNVGLD